MTFEDVAKACSILCSHGNKGKILAIYDGMIFVQKKKKMQIFYIKRLVKKYNAEIQKGWDEE